MKTRRLYLVTVFLIPMILGWFLLPYVVADDGRRLPKEIDFIYQETQFMSAERIALWHERMRTEPGITPILLKAVMDGFAAKHDGIFKSAAFALRFRSDLTDEQLQPIKSKMRELSSKDIKNNSHEDHMMAVDFLSSCVRVLEKYPTSDNEDIALSLLEKQTDNLVQENAVLALGSIGTKKSQAAVKKFAERYKGDSFYTSLLEAQQKIEERIRNENSDTSRLQTTAPRAGGTAPNNSPGTTQPIESENTEPSFMKWWMFMIFLFGGIVVWLALRKK